MATVSGSAPADAPERHDRRDYRDEAQQGSECRRSWDNREQCTEDGDDERHRTQAIARGWWLVGIHRMYPFLVVTRPLVDHV